MKCEEILSVVDRIWNSDDDAVSISRGWMSHYQVIAAALEIKGENAYLRTKGGLDFGIKVVFIPKSKPLLFGGKNCHLSFQVLLI